MQQQLDKSTKAGDDMLRTIEELESDLYARDQRIEGLLAELRETKEAKATLEAMLDQVGLDSLEAKTKLAQEVETLRK